MEFVHKMLILLIVSSLLVQLPASKAFNSDPENDRNGRQIFLFDREPSPYFLNFFRPNWIPRQADLNCKYMKYNCF